MKRLFVIIASIIVVLGIGVAVYFVFFASAAPHLTVSTANPFGDTGSGTVTPTTPSTPEQVAGSAGTVVAPNLIKITGSAVAAGAVAFDIVPIFASATSTSLAPTGATSTVANGTFSSPDIEVRYIERQSGNVYAYRAQARSLTRISNKTLPGIQEASWLPNGSLSFVRFLAQVAGGEHLNTYALPADGNGGYFLQSDLDQVSVTGSSTLFTLTAGTNGSIGTVAHSDGSGARTLFTSPLASIIVQAVGNSFVAVTKAASEIDGYAFSITSTGSFTPILGPLRGLTALLSPSGNLLLYSYTDGNRVYMSILNLTNGSVTTLPLATLTEKCVWTSDSAFLYCGIPTNFSGNLPDDWFQGATSFTDRIWRIDLANRLATLVVDPVKTGKTAIDAVNLTLDPNTQLLVFRNKKDSSLWAFSL
ncbi:hypothetical protein H0X32_03825 [Patescibacteria group bacterium]|nr:hypothetical protein [Patescibacteria group bacterium]